MALNGKTTFTVLAPLAAAAALAISMVLSGPALAIHKDGHASPPNGDQTTTLSDLQCAQDQVAQSDGAGGWSCADVDDTLGGLTCAEGQIAKFDGAAWACTADDDTDNDTLDELDCALGDYARLDPTTGEWVCHGVAELKLALGLTKTVFATSDTYDGDLVAAALAIDAGFSGSGLEAGDLICDEHAKSAGLAGDYIAWLSDTGTDAKDRFPPGTGPFVKVDGVLVALDMTDLTDGTIAAPINIAEDGGASGSSSAWTGTGSTGLRRGPYCEDWTSNIHNGSINHEGRFGETFQTSSSWTSEDPGRCDVVVSLYCFQK